MTDLQPEKMTWAVLLGRWVEFAQSALALPDDADGAAWKASVPDIIGLQALTMALGDAPQLSPNEQALALDRANILLERHTRNLNSNFTSPPLNRSLPPKLHELIDDAQLAITHLQRLQN